MEITEDLSPETTEEKDRQNETQTLTVRRRTDYGGVLNAP
jgi:hypothetical protein